MSGAILLRPLYAFMTWTGTNLGFLFLGTAGSNEPIFLLACDWERPSTENKRTPHFHCMHSKLHMKFRRMESGPPR